MKKTYSAVGKVVSNVIKSFQLSRKRREKLGRNKQWSVTRASGTPKRILYKLGESKHGLV